MSRPGPPKSGARIVSVAGASRLVAAKAKPCTKSLRGFWKKSVDPTVSSWILSTLSFGLSSSAISKKGTTRRRLAAGPDCAASRAACRTADPGERTPYSPGKGLHATFGTSRRPARRRPDERRRCAGTARSPARRSRRSRGRAGRRPARAHDRRAVEAEGGEAVLAGVAEGGENLAVVRRPWSPCRARWPSHAPRAAACDGSARALPSGEKANGQRVGRAARARPRASRRNGSRARIRRSAACRDAARRARSPRRVVGAPDDELSLGRAIGRKRRSRA